MSEARLKQFHEVRTFLRYWVTPLGALLRKDPPADTPTVLAQIRRFDQNRADLQRLVQDYCTDDGHAYAVVIGNELASASNRANALARTLAQRGDQLTAEELVSEHRSLAERLDQMHDNVDKRLRAVPVDWTAAEFAKGDRFRATLHLSRLIGMATTRLDLVDRHLDDTLLHFMGNLPREIKINLVTTKLGVAATLPLARIAVKQYANMTLLQLPSHDFHRRCIRVDDQIFRADESFKDLALHDSPRISEAITSQEAHAELDAIIAAGNDVPL